MVWGVKEPSREARPAEKRVGTHAPQKRAWNPHHPEPPQRAPCTESLWPGSSFPLKVPYSLSEGNSAARRSPQTMGRARTRRRGSALVWQSVSVPCLEGNRS